MMKIDDVKNMSRTAVLRELARFSRPKEIKATYIKTVKPDEVFEREDENPTTEVHRVKYMGKEVYIPIIKEREITEGALGDKFINKILSKVKDSKTKDLVSKYLNQAEILNLEEGRYLTKYENLPKKIKKDEKTDRTKSNDIMIHPSFIDKNKELSKEEFRRENKEEKPEEKEVEELTIEELKPKAKEANRIINELKKRLLIPIVDAELKPTKKQAKKTKGKNK